MHTIITVCLHFSYRVNKRSDSSWWLNNRKTKESKKFRLVLYPFYLKLAMEKNIHA